MKIGFTTAFVDAARLYHRDSALLLPLAGATLFLPQYALLLLVPPMSATLPAGAFDGNGPNAAGQAAIADAVSAWLASYGGWYVVASLLGLFGALAVMTLYLTREGPTLSGALRRAGALSLRYLLASILIGVVALSILLPGVMARLLLAALMPLAFYILGRTMLAGPAIVGEAPTGAIAAIQRSWALTRGNGWMLGATYAAPLFCAQLIGSALLSLVQFGGGNPVIGAIVGGLVALVQATAALTLALVEVTLYRRLANTGT
jgi:hypothetical protein